MKFGTFLLRADGVREAEIEDFGFVREVSQRIYAPDTQKFLYEVDNEIIDNRFYWYNGPPVKTTHEKIIVNQIIPYQPILSPEPPWYRNERSNCPAEQGCLDRLGLAGTMALARCPQLLNPLRTLAAAAQPARTRLSRSVACDAKQLW